MSTTVRKLLRIYGSLDRCDAVRAIVEALAGRLRDAGSRSDSDARLREGLLAEIRFIWPSESPVEWVVGLSERMPSETFELLTLPSCSVQANCEVLRAGILVDGWNPPDESWPGVGRQKLQVPASGAIDLLAMATGAIKELASFSAEHQQLDWDDFETRFLISNCCESLQAIKLLLTPKEAAVVAGHEKQLMEQTKLALDRSRDAALIQRAIQLISGRLGEGDQGLLDRLAQIEATLVSESCSRVLETLSAELREAPRECVPF